MSKRVPGGDGSHPLTRKAPAAGRGHGPLRRGRPRRMLFRRLSDEIHQCMKQNASSFLCLKFFAGSEIIDN